MAWQIEFDSAAVKELARLDRQVARRIVAFLRERIATAEDPRTLGEALRGAEPGSFWKYRLGDYGVIAEIVDHRVVIIVVRIGHRRAVYRR